MAEIFSKCDIDVNLVMQLLVHSQRLAVDIVACETNILHSVRSDKKKQQATDLWLLCNKQAEEFNVFEFPCIVSLYYIRNQQDATLAVSFLSHCKITLHVLDAFCVLHQEY